MGGKPQLPVVRRGPKGKKKGPDDTRWEGMSGNQNSLKFKTPAERQEVCRQLIDHLRNAFDKKSFVPCDWQTIESYMERFPDDFPKEEIEEAAREGQRLIEGILLSVATGKLKSGNASAAIFLAKNKINYTDRQDLTIAQNPEGQTFRVEDKDKVERMRQRFINNLNRGSDDGRTGSEQLESN